MQKYNWNDYILAPQTTTTYQITNNTHENHEHTYDLKWKLDEISHVASATVDNITNYVTWYNAPDRTVEINDYRMPFHIEYVTIDELINRHNKEEPEVSEDFLSLI